MPGSEIWEPGKSAAAHRKKAALDRSPGTVGLDGGERLVSANAGDVAVALNLRAEGLQGQFAVVAGADGFFDNGFAGGEQAGKEDARLDLGAGDFRLVVNRFRWPP